MKKTKILSWLIFLLAAPLTLILGLKLSGSGYYVVSTLMIVELLIPFFLSFEGRKPQARELVLIAVMCALAVASRVLIAVPNFKPIFALIMITGIAFGAETGFLVGAVAALASNFFFSQGPYTPWQMMAYGIAGFAAGILFHKKGMSVSKVQLAVGGFCCVLLLVGPILDICTIFLASITTSFKTVTAILAAGLLANFSQSVSTGVILFLLGRSMLEKLDRIKRKYGMEHTDPSSQS